MPPRPFRGRPLGPRPGAVAGAALVGAAAGAYVASHRRPGRVHHLYRERVVVVTRGTTRTVRLICPGGVGEGMVIEIAVDGRAFFVNVPAGVRPGMTFDVQIPGDAPTDAQPPPPPPVVVRPPPFVPAAAIVSDNHGTWTRTRYDTLRGAENAWSKLSMFFASVVFVQTKTGGFAAFKEYGTGSAVAKIKQRFHEEFVFELFPDFRPVPTVTAAPVQQQTPSVAAAPPPPAPPPAIEVVAAPTTTAAAPSAPPSYTAPPPDPPLTTAPPVATAPPAYE